MLFGRWATLIGNGLNGTEGDTDTEMEEDGGQRRDDGGKKRGRTRVPRSESCHSFFLP